MAAGGMRTRVTFQEAIETKDGAGGQSIAWGGDKYVWGKFSPERGSERFTVDRLQASVGGVLKVRASSYLSTVSEAWRVMIKGEPYSISSITNPDQRDRFLEIVVDRGVAS